MKWGMFSAEGAAAVDDIIARAYNADDAIQRLELLAGEGKHKEANDTAVRESVWCHYNPPATHCGERMKARGKCEVCATPTNWTVTIQGRARAYWCGCGN